MQLDLKVFERFNVHGMGVPTALVVQDTQKVHRVLPAFPNVLSEQLSVLLADIVPDAIKIGMLATDDLVLTVVRLLDHLDVPRVVDPVLMSSGGQLLLETRAYGSLMDGLVRGAALVTPNLDEAEALVGTRDAEAAGRAFLEVGAQAALIKGGHADGDADDVLVMPDSVEVFRSTRIPDASVHGTGCALSSAIAAGLARGKGVVAATRMAKTFVSRAIEGARAVGAGQSFLRFESVDA